MLSILIADQHDIFQAGFSAIINRFPFVGEVTVARNSNELLTIIHNVKINVALVDSGLFPLCGSEITRHLKTLQPQISVIGMSISISAASVIRMMEAGASGFILKTISSQNLSDAILAVSSKKKYLCGEIEKYIDSKSWKQVANSDFPIHSQRTREMLFLICRELTSKEIGSKLQISEKTVEKYRKQLLAATGSKNVVGLALYAIQQNIMNDIDLQNKFEPVSVPR